MGTSLASLNAIMKEVYGPRIVDQLENETTALKRIEKTSRGTTSEVGGKYVTFPLKTRRNHGLGYRNELEQLMPAGKQGWNNVRVGLKYGYGRVSLSGQSIELVNDNAQAFASAITEEMNGLKQDILKDTNRIIWGDGLGVLGTATAAVTGSNVIAVDSLHWFDLDQQVDLLAANGATTIASNRKVIGIDEANKTVTLDGAAITGSASGNILTRFGNYGKEPQGFSSLVKASGTLFNLDPTVEPLWKSHEDNSGGALSESKMIAMCDKIRTKGGRPSVIFSDLDSRRAYFNLLKTERRFTNTQEFDGGFKGLAFSYEGDIPVVTDVDAPSGKMWFLQEDSFKVYRSKAWDWETRDGNIWKPIAGYDAVEAFMKQYWEFATERRNVNGVMTGITPG